MRRTWGRAGAAALVVVITCGMPPRLALATDAPAAATDAPGAATPGLSVDAAIAIRSDLGLDADTPYVQATFADAVDYPIRTFYGVPMSRTEAAELQRRIEVQQRTTEARRWAADQFDWAGTYTDQKAGGVPVFMFAGDAERYRSGLERVMPVDVSYELESVGSTMTDLVIRRNDIVEMLSRLAADGIQVQSVGVDILANDVRVGVVGLTSTQADELAGLLPAGVDVRSEEVAVLDACSSRTNCGNPIKGGLQIAPPNPLDWCTAAYIGEYLNYSPAHLRVVTAGHCISLGGGIAANWSHNGVVFGTSTTSTWANGADGDVGIITVANDPNDDNLVYASSNSDIRHFTSYAFLSDVNVNDFICRSGARTNYLCGRVVALDETLDVDGHLIDHQNRVDFDASPGDSGAPYLINQELDGIHSDSTDDWKPLPHYAWYTPYVWATNIVPSVKVCLTSTC